MQLQSILGAVLTATLFAIWSCIPILAQDKGDSTNKPSAGARHKP